MIRTDEKRSLKDFYNRKRETDEAAPYDELVFLMYNLSKMIRVTLTKQTL